ncbi:hypothetical protein GALMADRAFT_145941 [Galerina marginata CBS 339.88]|uniref:Uncharacterized protein n=1 Tax=Galerina marginata (strain CBS 339.88) TaxID=685588 RepID=A0A067SMK6_GALM3|nr:hypothetical protein GALMADRAFT_145941 [Galerina marginata CBS 339.88]
MANQDLVDDPAHAYISYNKLPSLLEANHLFTDRTTIFQELISQDVLGGNGELVVTLVHRHASLERGEIMVTRGKVTEPEQADSARDIFPSAWLANGQPFEYSVGRGPQGLDISSLLRRIESLPNLPRFNGIAILGLRYIPGGCKENELCLEITHGRSSIAIPIPYPLSLWLAIPTCWHWHLRHPDPTIPQKYERKDDAVETIP